MTTTLVVIGLLFLNLIHWIVTSTAFMILVGIVCSIAITNDNKKRAKRP